MIGPSKTARGVVTATSLHTLDHGRLLADQARVVADNGAFRYDATLFSRDKRHLLLRRSSEKERRRERGSSFTKRPLTTTTQPSIVKVNIALTPPPPAPIDEYPREEAGFACTILHPRRKNICMRVMKGWGKKLADSLGSSVAVERIQRTARPEGLMRRAIRKQPRLIAARTASDTAEEESPFYPFHHLRQRVKVELHITGDISLARRRVEWSLSPPPSSSLTGEGGRGSRQSS